MNMLENLKGTTGKPKAAVGSHFAAVNNSYNIGKRNELNKQHHTICVQVPFFHVFGLIVSILAGLNHGATLVIPSATYSPDRNLEAIEKERCSTIHGTPTMFVDLVNKQLNMNLNISPEIAVSGGSPCSTHLFQQMLEVLKLKKVKSVFGLTETTAVVFQSVPGENQQKSISTVGHLHDHLEAKVVDDQNNIVPLGTPGELCIRGYQNTLGYWEDKEKTEELIGEDRWLRTGDQFVLEEDGYGKIVGRLKEMIIRGGENIFPKEIEDLLITHPDIVEVYVVGLPHERLGEEVCACVRLRDGSRLNSEVVRQYCKKKIANFKIPSKVEFLTEFPKTASGKIQKFKLVDLMSNK